MYEVFEVKQRIPQDLPTHWSIYKLDGSYDPAVTVWTSKEDADKICELMNKEMK